MGAGAKGHTRLDRHGGSTGMLLGYPVPRGADQKGATDRLERDGMHLPKAVPVLVRNRACRESTLPGETEFCEVGRQRVNFIGDLLVASEIKLQSQVCLSLPFQDDPTGAQSDQKVDHGILEDGWKF